MSYRFSEVEVLKENIERVIEAGAVVINFEDQIIEGGELFAIEDQCTRIEAIRETTKKGLRSAFHKCPHHFFSRPILPNMTKCS